MHKAQRHTHFLPATSSPPPHRPSHFLHVTKGPNFANYDTGQVVVAHHAIYDASHINDDDNSSHVDKDDKDDNACHIDNEDEDSMYHFDDNEGGMLC